MSQEESNPRVSVSFKEESKKVKHPVTLFGLAEEIARVKEFCEEEGLYLGRFLLRVAIRHIEDVEHERISKRLERLK